MATRTLSPIRDAAFERANHSCERCGHQVWLELHHVVGRMPPRLVNEPDNLMVVCRDCHGWMHTHPIEAARWFITKYGSDRWAFLQDLKRGEKRVPRRFAEAG